MSNPSSLVKVLKPSEKPCRSTFARMGNSSVWLILLRPSPASEGNGTRSARGTMSEKFSKFGVPLVEFLFDIYFVKCARELLSSRCKIVPSGVGGRWSRARFDCY